MLSIHKITAADTYPIRHRILRKGEDFQKCIYPYDTDNTTVHFGLFENNSLAAVVSLFKTKSTFFQTDEQYQIRGMAVLEEHQKKGYGAALIRQVEAHLETQNNCVIWFNARIIALGFYEKMGYEKTGGPFKIDTIGIHYIMFKKCN